MEILGFIIIFFVYAVIDYYITKFQIKKNIDLFYALHQVLVDKELKKYEKR